MEKLTDNFILNNGVKIPCVGFGTWKAPSGDVAYSAVRSAIDAGYRHIDTAAAYKNEESVGRAVRDSGIPREEIFVTSKLWNTERGYEKTLAAFDATMSRLGLDYLDLYLIHWPAIACQFENWEELNLETWRAMTELYKKGRIRAIGVSNFMSKHLRALLETEVKPMVDQIELHPGLIREDTLRLCEKEGIVVEAWSPLGSGRLLSDPTLAGIAAKYGKSVAQICLRWCLQKGTLPLPKSVTPSRIEENARIFDFDISPEDMLVIDAMPDVGGSGHDPDSVDF